MININNFGLQKKSKFREWEALAGPFRYETKQNSVLFAMYGGQEPTFLTQGRGEKPIQTVSHWSDVISWLHWRFFCIKKVVMLRLEHPIPFSVMDDMRERYEEVVRYLQASPFSQSRSSAGQQMGVKGGPTTYTNYRG